MSITKAVDFDPKDFPEGTKFVLDTNILYFVHSGYYLPSEPKSITYSNILQELLVNKRSVIVSALNVQELLYGIENNEYRLYLKANNLKPCTYSKKDYRQNAVERNRLQAKMSTILNELSAAYEFVDGEIKQSQIAQFVKDFEKHQYDPVDYALVDGLNIAGQIVFISDDVDFQRDSKIDLVTA